MTVKNIYDSFKNKDYESTLINIDEYLSKPQSRLTDDIMLKYIYSLIFIGELDKAYEKTNEMKRVFPNSLSEYKIASIYIQCGKLDEAKNILEFITLNQYQAFSLAKQFYFYGLYKEAREYFILTKHLAGDDKELRRGCNFFMRNIGEHHRKEKFIEMEYDKFKIYNRLKPGHIVLAKNSTEANSYNASRRGLYLIWRNVTNELYSFPLSSFIDEEHREKEKAFIIDYTKHPHLRKDRRIKNISVPLEESDLDKVVGKLSTEEYKLALHNIYKKFTFISTEKHSRKNETFIKFFREKVIKIKPDDTILVFNRDENKLDNYRVLEYDEESSTYIARKLIYDNGEYTDTDIITQLGIESRILDTVKETSEKRIDEVPKQKILKPNNN